MEQDERSNEEPQEELTANQCVVGQETSVIFTAIGRTGFAVDTTAAAMMDSRHRFIGP